MKSRKPIAVEVHLYAPELNTLHYADGSEVRVPGCTTVQEAVDMVKSQKEKTT